MSVSINMTITNAGFQAIFNANNTGVELNLTHLQLGSGQRTTDKSETTLVSPIQFQAITAAERPSLNQVRMSAVFPITQTYDICEIGIWAGEPGTSGSVLFAYWASPDGKLVTTAPGVDFVFTHDMTMDQSVADSINVVIDPNASSFLSLLNLHLNDAGDPHSQYLKKTDFDNAVIDLQNTVSNNTSGSFTSHTNASDPHPQYTTDTEAGTIAASAITAHTSETNPHKQYALTSHTHSNATETEDGLMSANDKKLLTNLNEYLYFQLSDLIFFQKVAGIIIQGGAFLKSGTQEIVSLVFPYSFPTKCFSVVCSSIRYGDGSNGHDYISNLSNSGCTMTIEDVSGGAYWIAIGC